MSDHHQRSRRCRVCLPAQRLPSRSFRFARPPTLSFCLRFACFHFVHSVHTDTSICFYSPLRNPFSRPGSNAPFADLKSPPGHTCAYLEYARPRNYFLHRKFRNPSAWMLLEIRFLLACVDFECRLFVTRCGHNARSQFFECLAQAWLSTTLAHMRSRDGRTKATTKRASHTKQNGKLRLMDDAIGRAAYVPSERRIIHMLLPIVVRRWLVLARSRGRIFHFSQRRSDVHNFGAFHLLCVPFNLRWLRCACVRACVCIRSSLPFGKFRTARKRILRL